ncbi:hypothetical protein [Actinospica sp.]|uniref:hypothetical protein n=1 Tax=Actinospica sp. TaxID=1872142 RepID=UPI002C8A209E|nr:hypothetical protein [Actinospica sp.]HWG23996.1 hypothetical protein [Actinospica sp.]
MEDVAVTWRPPARHRVIGLLLSVGIEAAACVCVVQAFTERGGWGLAPIGILMAGIGGFFIRHVTRSSVTLDRDALIVTNTLKTHTVPLAEITGVSATPNGLKISRTAQPTLTARAIQKSKWSVDTGNQMTRADDIASDILAARSRPISSPSPSETPKRSEQPPTHKPSRVVSCADRQPTTTCARGPAQSQHLHAVELHRRAFLCDAAVTASP